MRLTLGNEIILSARKLYLIKLCKKSIPSAECSKLFLPSIYFCYRVTSFAQIIALAVWQHRMPNNEQLFKDVYTSISHTSICTIYT